MAIGGSMIGYAHNAHIYSLGRKEKDADKRFGSHDDAAGLDGVFEFDVGRDVPGRECKGVMDDQAGPFDRCSCD